MQNIQTFFNTPLQNENYLSNNNKNVWYLQFICNCFVTLFVHIAFLFYGILWVWGTYARLLIRWVPDRPKSVMECAGTDCTKVGDCLTCTYNFVQLVRTTCTQCVPVPIGCARSFQFNWKCTQLTLITFPIQLEKKRRTNTWQKQLKRKLLLIAT